MFNNCSNCEYGIEHKNENYTFIECSIENDIKNSSIEWYDGCPYFRNKFENDFIERFKKAMEE
jgi:hypothetical protein